ncbi:MAG: hypothetical protein N2035_01935 [Chthoniobacterales bacterium]|nr:hypothetical protein [Chthoniobacterales bacterium]
MPQKEEQRNSEPGMPVGRVYFVNLEQRFAVVETTNWMQLPVGVELVALENGVIQARARATADRRPPFVAVEIVEGHLYPGQNLLLLEDSFLQNDVQIDSGQVLQMPRGTAP